MWKNNQHTLCPFIRQMLCNIDKAGYKIALVSFNGRADEILDMYCLTDLFDFIQFEYYYNGSTKKKMFHDLNIRSQVAFKNMIFFDDDMINIQDASSLGITACHVGTNGVDMKTLNNGIYKFQIQNRII
jgi:FMN phosphatase YigB (HAD superfamily)